jgi:thiol-disulfide isomerase/thioredoxin
MIRLALAALALSVAAPAVARAQDEGGLAPGSVAPAVVVNDLDGKPVNLAQYLGKRPVVLEFWATWCENCEALLPEVKAAHAKYGGAADFIGVNVTVNQTPARVRRYLEQHQPPYRTLWDDKGAAVRAYKAPATSYVVIVNKEGKVAYSGIGPKQDLVGALGKAVAE